MNCLYSYNVLEQLGFHVYGTHRPELGGGQSAWLKTVLHGDRTGWAVKSRELQEKNQPSEVGTEHASAVFRISKSGMGPNALPQSGLTSFP